MFTFIGDWKAHGYRQAKYLLGKRMMRKAFKRDSSTIRCRGCNTWSHELETPFIFTHAMTEEVLRLGEKITRHDGNYYNCCSQCGTITHWNYAIAPVAICLGHTPPLDTVRKLINWEVNHESNDVDTSVVQLIALSKLPDVVLKHWEEVDVKNLGKSPRIIL